MPPGLLMHSSRGNKEGEGVITKKRIAPQPPKPARNALPLSIKNKVDDSYSTMSTVSVASLSPNSTVSEKSIRVKPTARHTLLLPPRNLDNSSSNTAVCTPGWIRVFCGPERSEYFDDDPNKVLQINHSDTAKQISIAMDLPLEYTIWLQMGGQRARRLLDTECPLVIQEAFLRRLGYANEFRRSRMGIDPDLKFMLRFHIGPAQSECCRGVTKSGQVEILKGLVSPQWKTRTMCVLGSRFMIFPANNSVQPECFELCGAEICDGIVSNSRFVIKIVPRAFDGPAAAVANGGCQIVSNVVYNSNQSLSSGSWSGSAEKEPKVLFLGFGEPWERDLWSAWLTEATTEPSNHKRMDIGNAGLQTIPEIVFQSTNVVEELLAGQNKLQEIALTALAGFPCLKVLRLPGNGFNVFPEALLQITGLTVLDLADNAIQSIPDGIADLKHLEDFRIDRNALTELPNSLRQLTHLQSLHASQNSIEKLPDFLLSFPAPIKRSNMKTLGFVDSYSQKVNNMIYQQQLPKEGQEVASRKHPLNRINLRSNQLKGNIILGNYGNLTQLDVSDNQIETMNLLALDKLETLQCSRNHLIELIVNGKSITSLITGNNKLLKLVVTPSPTNLVHLDLSYNNITELPDFLSGCHQLRTVFASNNCISSLPEHLFANDRGSLHTLQLGYNRITRLPAMAKKRLPLRELFLQSNQIEDLPEHFFYGCESLTLLNVAGNKLRTLPIVPDGVRCQLERLYATENALTDRVLDTLINLPQLRILHAAYNRLTTFTPDTACCWPDLEEVVLSGNRLKHLPESLAALQNLRVLRVHSNQLQSVPALAKTTSLRVLDLAHNQLDKINLVSLVSRRLQFLDLSGNSQLQVDAKQLQVCKSQRPMSLVDVSGQNRDSLPTISPTTTPHYMQQHQPVEEDCQTDVEPPWRVGFSETSGSASKLYISQLRLAGFCNGEGLFGMFDGEQNRVSAGGLVKSIPKILVQERTIPETAAEYMKYTLLAAHRELRQQGQKHGISATLCHVSRAATSNKRFVLRVASVGESSAILIRPATGCVQLTPGTPNRQIGGSPHYPLMMIVPDPEVCELALSESSDEYLVVANKKLWDVLTPEQVAQIIRTESDVSLASKRIQDISQAFGVEDNLSVIVVKFQLRLALRSDMENVIRELRTTIKKRPINNGLSGFCKCGCCCEVNNNSCCHATITTAGQQQHAMFVRQPSSSRSDRSSPSGQSDPATTGPFETVAAAGVVSGKSSVASRRSGASYLANERRSMRGGNGGVVRAVRARIEEEREKEESDSAVSEQEQFKCWEYMLEQNTQLLFDKELNTISKAFASRRPSLVSAVAGGATTALTTNLSRTQLKALSSSSPQLQALQERINNKQPAISECNLAQPPQTNVPFLSKHFGSARSFHPQPTLSTSTSSGLFRTMRLNRGSSGGVGNVGIQGGPNAAYFGSLQRLMPYNLEYDFAVMQERGDVDIEGLEADDRMGQYWGVATTEL